MEKVSCRPAIGTTEVKSERYIVLYVGALVRLPLNCTVTAAACMQCNAPGVSRHDFTTNLLTFEHLRVTMVLCCKQVLCVAEHSWQQKGSLGAVRRRLSQFQPGASGTASPTSSPVSAQVRGWLLNCAMYAVRVWLLRFGPLQCHRSSQNNTCEQQHSTAQQPVMNVSPGWEQHTMK